jgi:hypothetical protein
LALGGGQTTPLASHPQNAKKRKEKKNEFWGLATTPLGHGGGRTTPLSILLLLLLLILLIFLILKN